MTGRSDVMQLLGAYQAGLREVVQDQATSRDGWARLDRLATFLASWFQRPDWFDLWTLTTAAQVATVDDPDVAQTLVEWRLEEWELVDRLVKATGTADAAALQKQVRVIVSGGQTIAALGAGHATAEALRRLLALVWQEQERPPDGVVAPSPWSASGGPSAGGGHADRRHHAMV